MGFQSETCEHVKLSHDLVVSPSTPKSPLSIEICQSGVFGIGRTTSTSSTVFFHAMTETVLTASRELISLDRKKLMRFCAGPISIQVPLVTKASLS